MPVVFSGARLRALTRDREIRFEELATITGLSFRFIDRLGRDEARRPSAPSSCSPTRSASSPATCSLMTGKAVPCRHRAASRRLRCRRRPGNNYDGCSTCAATVARRNGAVPAGPSRSPRRGPPHHRNFAAARPRS